MISQLINEKGNAIKNQIVITENNFVEFQSYSSKICKINHDEKIIYLYPDWNYSKTTSKYLYKFMRDCGLNVHTVKDILKAIDNKKIDDYILKEM